MFVVKQTSTGYLLQSGDSLDVVIFFNRNSTKIRPNLDFEGTFFFSAVILKALFCFPSYLSFQRRDVVDWPPYGRNHPS